LSLVVPSSPGGGFDQTARALQEAMQSNGIVRAVQVENMPGGGGMVAMAAFAKRKGEGKVLLMGGLALVSAVLTTKAPVSMTELTPIARLTAEWQAIAVPPNSDIKTVADLVSRMKANPRSVAWAGGAAGSLDHVTVGLFAQEIGVEPKNINYVAHSGGGQAAVAIMGGHVQVGVSGVSEFEQMAKGGKLRLLAVMAPARVEGISTPTLKEGGIDLEVGNWRAVFAPAALSAEDQKQLSAAVEATTKTSGWKDTLAKKGWSPAYMGGEAFKAFTEAETSKFASVLRSVGLIN
jgi:putative tricarboxylic transport membrane protein